MAETPENTELTDQAGQTGVARPPEASASSEPAQQGPSGEELQQQEAAELAERKRRVRPPLKIPVTLSWVDDLGEAVEEFTSTENVSSFGCRVATQKPLREGLEVVCLNNATRRVARGKVVWSARTDDEKPAVGGIEFPELDPEFWGSEFLVALIEAQAVAPKPPPPPEVVEKQGEARRGLLYALMSTLLYFFLGGYSTWVVYVKVSPIVQDVLAPMIFVSGIALALYASVQAMRISGDE